MINFDEITRENTEEHSPHWPQIPDHPYRIFDFRQAKTIRSPGVNNMNGVITLNDVEEEQIQ